MPTVLKVNGWRLYFYSNEGNEPPHIHCIKAEKSCKFFINIEEKTVNLAKMNNIKEHELKEIKNIVISNIDLIISEWNKYFN